MDWGKNWTNRQFFKTRPDAQTETQTEDVTCLGKPGRINGMVMLRIKN